MSALFEERVLDVRHWTDTLFSFKTTRDAACRFKNGQFVMLGLQFEGRPLMRAYSIASPNYAEELEFFSIKVQNGPLTSRLQHLAIGDSILVGRKPTGTLVLDNLRDGRNLYLLATGTGLAPFLATIRDPETYERFSTVVLVHGVRTKAELAYRDLIESELPKDEFLGELVGFSLRYYPTVTREPFHNQGRIPDLVESGKLFKDLALPPLDPEWDRVMICGNPQLITDMPALLEDRGFTEGNTGEGAIMSSRRRSSRSSQYRQSAATPPNERFYLSLPSRATNSAFSRSASGARVSRVMAWAVATFASTKARPSSDSTSSLRRASALSALELTSPRFISRSITPLIVATSIAVMRPS
jgi:ferredoxin--NADP+ reductase